jgi:hypothetical protein
MQHQEPGHVSSWLGLSLEGKRTKKDPGIDCLVWEVEDKLDLRTTSSASNSQFDYAIRYGLEFDLPSIRQCCW